jgi:hypothetical protein
MASKYTNHTYNPLGPLLRFITNVARHLDKVEYIKIYLVSDKVYLFGLIMLAEWVSIQDVKTYLVSFEAEIRHIV